MEYGVCHQLLFIVYIFEHVAVGFSGDVQLGLAAYFRYDTEIGCRGIITADEEFYNSQNYNPLGPENGYFTSWIVAYKKGT